MTEHFTDARPKQIRVADDLREKIKEGTLEPGSMLPSLHTLAADYHVSVTAMRRAIDLLKNEGLILSKQGKGNFVRTPVSVRRLGIDRYRRSIWSGAQGTPILKAEAESQGRVAAQNVREMGERPTPAVVANRLGISEGDLAWVRRRLTRIDERPNQTLDSWFPLSVVEEAPQLKEESTGTGGTFARLDEIGPITDIQEDLEARMPSGPEAALLELPQGTPVYEVIRVIYAGERPMEVGHFVMAADMANFSYRFPIPD